MTSLRARVQGGADACGSGARYDLVALSYRLEIDYVVAATEPKSMADDLKFEERYGRLNKIEVNWYLCGEVLRLLFPALNSSFEDDRWMIAGTTFGPQCTTIQTCNVRYRANADEYDSFRNLSIASRAPTCPKNVPSHTS